MQQLATMLFSGDTIAERMVRYDNRARGFEEDALLRPNDGA